MSDKFWHKATVGAFSSAVGAPIILTDVTGKHVGQIILHSFGNASEDFDKDKFMAALHAICDALNAWVKP